MTPQGLLGPHYTMIGRAEFCQKKMEIFGEFFDHEKCEKYEKKKKIGPNRANGSYVIRLRPAKPDFDVASSPAGWVI
jgi:hypothetical protein